MSILLDKPYLINFPKTGGSVNGYISIAEKKDLPFIPKRVYWTYFTPESLERGGHAHINLEQILVAVSGVINLKIETCEGEIFKFILNSPSIGVFLPKKCWRTMRYSHNAVQMCIASIEYNESDYVRDYKEFKKIGVK